MWLLEMCLESRSSEGLVEMVQALSELIITPHQAAIVFVPLNHSETSHPPLSLTSHHAGRSFLTFCFGSRWLAVRENTTCQTRRNLGFSHLPTPFCMSLDLLPAHLDTEFRSTVEEAQGPWAVQIPTNLEADLERWISSASNTHHPPQSTVAAGAKRKISDDGDIPTSASTRSGSKAIGRTKRYRKMNLHQPAQELDAMSDYGSPPMFNDDGMDWEGQSDPSAPVRSFSLKWLPCPTTNDDTFLGSRAPTRGAGRSPIPHRTF